ncbi:MAG: hypothetical protein C5B49_02280 [Bdellovibrio sp.]|nr:MAG: hypothetical protein C5B49_02280 [Bdellovibrio sp.]
MALTATLDVALTVGATMGCQPATDKYMVAAPGSSQHLRTRAFKVLSPAVDILFVIDDSGSMAAHQRNLARNLDLFLRGFQQHTEINFHIGVISTTEAEVDNRRVFAGPGAGRLSGEIRFVDRATAGGLAILKQNMMMGIEGSGTERMFSPVKLALTEPLLSGWNRGFYRPSAYLALVFLTDAEDSSHLTDQGTPRAEEDPLNLSPENFYSFLLQLKSHHSSQIMVYGAIDASNVDDAICSHDDPEVMPSRLEKFLRIAKAQYYGICDSQFGENLAQMGSDLVGRISQKLVLEQRPKPETIQVSMGGRPVPNDPLRGWSYDPVENCIHFGPGWVSEATDSDLDVSFEAQEL